MKPAKVLQIVGEIPHTTHDQGKALTTSSWNIAWPAASNWDLLMA